jgi:hypothetical protein
MARVFVVVRRNSKRYLFSGLVVVTLLAAVACVIFYPRYQWRIEDLSNGKTILEVPASPGDNVWILFVNSVEGLPVADRFVVNKDHQIVFTETIYQAPYAGYIQEEKAVNVAPGTMRISDLDQSMEEVTFFAGYTSKHMVFLNGTWVPLYDVARGGDVIRIHVRRCFGLTPIIGRVKSHE